MPASTGPSRSASFACTCGQVRGTIADPSPGAVNRVICYCVDCQTFARALGRPELLDAKGGSDIIQLAPATMTILQGHAQVACLRLSPKGLNRFHATCCGTPLGNTVGPRLPFIGVARQAFEVGGQDLDALFGPVIGAVHGEGAVGGPPPGASGIPLRLLFGVLGKLLRWRLTGKGWPHPFFNRGSGEPAFPVTILSRERRNELRSLGRAGPA